MYHKHITLDNSMDMKKTEWLERLQRFLSGHKTRVRIFVREVITSAVTLIITPKEYHGLIQDLRVKFG